MQWFKINLSKGTNMNIALIGLGMVSTTHVAAINNSNKNLKLPGVLGRNSEKIAQFAA